MKEEPFVRIRRSDAPVRIISLVSAIVDYVRWKNSSAVRSRQELRKQIMAIVHAVWSRATFYAADTHFRVLIDGLSNGPSVYVDWEAQEQVEVFP